MSFLFNGTQQHLHGHTIQSGNQRKSALAYSKHNKVTDIVTTFEQNSFIITEQMTNVFRSAAFIRLTYICGEFRLFSMFTAIFTKLCPEYSVGYWSPPPRTLDLALFLLLKRFSLFVRQI